MPNHYISLKFEYTRKLSKKFRKKSQQNESDYTYYILMSQIRGRIIRGAIQFLPFSPLQRGSDYVWIRLFPSIYGNKMF